MEKQKSGIGNPRGKGEGYSINRMVIKGFTEKKGANHSSRERVFQAEETTMTVFLSIRMSGQVQEQS